MNKLTTKIKHGKTKTREYITWRTIKQRCYNEKHTHYSYYGARGIKVCDRWFKSFENFLLDMGPKPSPKHTIERKRNEGDYSPDNCKWATHKEQHNNTRWNVYIKWNGETKTLTQWSEALGLHHRTIRYRMKKDWPINKILSPANTYIHKAQ